MLLNIRLLMCSVPCHSTKHIELFGPPRLLCLGWRAQLGREISYDRSATWRPRHLVGKRRTSRYTHAISPKSCRSEWQGAEPILSADCDLPKDWRHSYRTVRTIRTDKTIPVERELETDDYWSRSNHNNTILNEWSKVPSTKLTVIISLYSNLQWIQ